MAYRLQKINPIDTQARKAVGVSLPFSGRAVFNSTYQTKDAIKTNLINFFLTSKNERVFNPEFGSGLRNFVFENITDESIEITLSMIRRDLSIYFPTIEINNLSLERFPDENLINFKLEYSVRETNISDEVSINFEQ